MLKIELGYLLSTILLKQLSCNHCKCGGTVWEGRYFVQRIWDRPADLAAGECLCSKHLCYLFKRENWHQFCRYSSVISLTSKFETEDRQLKLATSQSGTLVLHSSEINGPGSTRQWQIWLTEVFDLPYVDGLCVSFVHFNLMTILFWGHDTRTLTCANVPLD